MMKLKCFRVQQFRSIKDSGWIEVDNVTTLIGVNEAGKSNVLLALWKLNPVREGKIDLLADLPRELYSILRDAKEKPDFIEAQFELPPHKAKEVASITGVPSDKVSSVTIKRNYDGDYTVNFPSAILSESIPSGKVIEVLQAALDDITQLDEVGKGESGIKDKAISALKSIIASCDSKNIGMPALQDAMSQIDSIESPLKTSEIAPRLTKLLTQFQSFENQLESVHPDDNEEAVDYILEIMPSFVYYSTYGNLDSEIYLPHVVENLRRTDLTGRVAAQTRTLRVLFSFVGLNPQEILDKGKEPTGQLNQQGQVINPPSQAEIDKAAAAKQERDVLLHSASTRLTKEFRNWWQGNYVFDLAADGNHFRIWVSDDERPAKVELENRSTGLQWFLSFFLVFLVESEASHQGTILLLDEAGLSLHAHAQRDLITFFERLSETNQLIHTTHSPFLVNTDHVDRIRVVFVNEEGHTVASSNLRAGERDPRQTKAIYAVHAALGLSVSEALLQGCYPIIVEGQSDQYYLSAIKIILISQGILSPNREIIFAPSGGVKGITSVAAILAAKEEDLPYVLVDSDENGKNFKKKLHSGQYQGLKERVCEVGEVLNLENCEVEDLFPISLMNPIINRLFRDIEDEYFDDVYDQKLPLVPQIESFAQKHGVELVEGWKVDVARQVKSRLLKQGFESVDEDTKKMWATLFEKLYPFSAENKKA